MPTLLAGREVPKPTDSKRFEADLNSLTSRLLAQGKKVPGIDDQAPRKLENVKDGLLRLRQLNLVKINHSALELLCAEKLIEMRYDVDVEHRLTETLVCDVYGKRGDDGVMIVEIETGFVPPDYALEPTTYSSARVASKIARYSSYADKFVVGTTPTNILGIPRLFMTPPRHRTEEGVKAVKALCDLYYNSPPVTLDQITFATLHTIYVIDLDGIRVQEVNPEEYLESISHLPYSAGARGKNGTTP